MNDEQHRGKDANPDEKVLQDHALNMVEMLFLLVAALPGIFFLEKGPATTGAQAIFRVAMIVVGVSGFIVMRLRRARRARGD